MAVVTTAKDPCQGAELSSRAETFNLLHKSGKTFELFNFRKRTEENAAQVMVCAVLWIKEQLLLVIFITVVSPGLAEDQGLFCWVLHSKLNSGTG